MKVIISSVCMLICAQSYAHSQPAASIADSVIEHSRVMRHSTLGHALSEIIKEAHVSAGIVLNLTDGRDPTSADMEIASGTRLRDALNYILGASDDRYHWVDNLGIINIVPRGGLPAVLQTQIITYHWNTLAMPNLSLSRLLSLPEVEEQLRRQGIRQGLDRGFGLQKPPRINDRVVEAGKDYVVSDVSLQEALNAVIRSYSVPTVWIYREAHVNNNIEVTLGDR